MSTQTKSSRHPSKERPSPAAASSSSPAAAASAAAAAAASSSSSSPSLVVLGLTSAQVEERWNTLTISTQLHYLKDDELADYLAHSWYPKGQYHREVDDLPDETCRTVASRLRLKIKHASTDKLLSMSTVRARLKDFIAMHGAAHPELFSKREPRKQRQISKCAAVVSDDSDAEPAAQPAAASSAQAQASPAAQQIVADASPEQSPRRSSRDRRGSGW